MPTADSQLILACVVVYLASCAVVGFWAMRRTSSTVDFFLAGKSLGPLVVVMATISSVMSGFGFVGGPGLVYESGTSSLWMVFVASFSLPVAFMLTGKRLRLLVEVRPILTLPEAVAARYGGSGPAIAMSVAIVLGVLGYLGTQVLAIGTVLQAVLGIDLLAALAVGLRRTGLLRHRGRNCRRGVYGSLPRAADARRRRRGALPVPEGRRRDVGDHRNAVGHGSRIHRGRGEPAGTWPP